VKVTESRLDPTLDLDLLHQNEQIKYAGNGRNIFVAGERIEAVVASPISPAGRTYRSTSAAADQPEVLWLREQARRIEEIFLSSGEDIFIASEGDIVNRRYRVLHISPAAVDIETY